MDYLFLDFGQVLAYPTTGEWFITPFMEQYIKERGFDKEEILSKIKYHRTLLDSKLLTMEQEEAMFYELFSSIFDLCNYRVSHSDLQVIADDITYSTNKYQMFKDVREELIELKNRHNLILLSDNWPCGEYLMDHWNLSEYFKKLYISSYYGIKKDDQGFFRIPMDEFGITPEEITFVDDGDVPLETATSMGIKVYKMDRYNKLTNDKYPVIHNLRGI